LINIPDSQDQGLPTKANVHELASSVFIGIDWACEGFKVTPTLRHPCQLRNLQALYGLFTPE
jgi:hypothetical protein